MGLVVNSCFVIFTEKMWCLSWKIGKYGLFGCSEFQWTKFSCNFLLLKRYWSKLRCSEMHWPLDTRFLNDLSMWYFFFNLFILFYKSYKLVQDLFFFYKLPFIFFRIFEKNLTNQKMPCLTVKCFVWPILNLEFVVSLPVFS